MLTCHAVRESLVSSPRPANAGVAAHLRECPDCRALAADWQTVDAAVKAVPTPASALAARDAFLDHLTPTVPRAPKSRRVAPAVRWAVAASLFLTLAAATFYLSDPRPVAAKPKIVGELVEFNLTLAEADTPDARRTLVRDRLPELKQAVSRAGLSEPDRQLADRLLAQGEWQAANDDPLAAAERLHGLAEEMLTMAERAEPASERSAVLVRWTAELADRGVTRAAKLAAEKAERQASMKAAREAMRDAKLAAARLARLAAAQERQAAKLAALAERQTAATVRPANGKKKNKKSY